MTAERQDTLSKFLPLVVAIAGLLANAGWVGYKSGQVTQELTAITQHLELHSKDGNLHMPLDRKYELFTPRAEFFQLKATRDAEIATMRAEISSGFAAVNAKIDRLFERRNGNGSGPDGD